MRERAFYRRQFLNTEEHGGTAFVEASVTKALPSDEYSAGTFDATFRVADCNRIVDLDFDVYHADAVENVRAKLVLFKKAVTDFVRAANAQLDAREEIIGKAGEPTK